MGVSHPLLVPGDQPRLKVPSLPKDSRDQVFCLCHLETEPGFEGLPACDQTHWPGTWGVPPKPESEAGGCEGRARARASAVWAVGGLELPLEDGLES